MTPDLLVDDPKKWWSRGLRSDRDLLENSMAFDLGLDKTSTSAEVDALIKTLDSWTLVMITEYAPLDATPLPRNGGKYRLCCTTRRYAGTA